ncbi:hypothetical protein BDR26DRAFT_918906 [Obelidium mucronatum]|nr:hypothetical protein BDR26DRAFT_918906 [Obelidium mucronatum]
MAANSPPPSPSAIPRIFKRPRGISMILHPSLLQQQQQHQQQLQQQQQHLRYHHTHTIHEVPSETNSETQSTRLVAINPNRTSLVVGRRARMNCMNQQDRPPNLSDLLYDLEGCDLPLPPASS